MSLLCCLLLENKPWTSYSVPHFLCGYFSVCHGTRTHERAEISGHISGYIYAGNPQSVSFSSEDAWDGWTGNLRQRTQRPEQSRGQWALIWLHLASVALYGYQFTGCYNGLVRCVYVHACTRVCVRTCVYLISFSDAWWLGGLVVGPAKLEVTRPCWVYNPIGLCSPQIIHIQSHSAWRRCYSEIAMTQWQEGRGIKMSWSNSSVEVIIQRTSGNAVVITHMTHSCCVNTVSSKFICPVLFKGIHQKKLSCRVPVSWKKMNQTMTQRVTSICLSRKVGIIFWV